MAKKIIIGNWKMNPKSAKEALSIAKKIQVGSKSKKNVTVVIAPPYPYIEILPKGILKGAQNLFFEEEGSYTGEVSAPMLKSLGVKYSIVGHSERRAKGETTESINKKIKSLLKFGITPILCSGELERDSHSEYLHKIKDDIKDCLIGIPKDSISKIIIAYEPVWAVGKNAKGVLDGEESLHMNIFIRKVISDIAGDLSAKKIKILYGGSVDYKNASQFLGIGKMDGLLVGRESLNTENFLKMINTANEI